MLKKVIQSMSTFLKSPLKLIMKSEEEYNSQDEEMSEQGLSKIRKQQQMRNHYRIIENLQSKNLQLQMRLYLFTQEQFQEKEKMIAKNILIFGKNNSFKINFFTILLNCILDVKVDSSHRYIIDYQEQQRFEKKYNIRQKLYSREVEVFHIRAQNTLPFQFIWIPEIQQQDFTGNKIVSRLQNLLKSGLIQSIHSVCYVISPETTKMNINIINNLLGEDLSKNLTFIASINNYSEIKNQQRPKNISEYLFYNISIEETIKQKTKKKIMNIQNQNDGVDLIISQLQIEKHNFQQSNKILQNLSEIQIDPKVFVNNIDLQKQLEKLQYQDLFSRIALLIADIVKLQQQQPLSPSEIQKQVNSMQNSLARVKDVIDRNKQHSKIQRKQCEYLERLEGDKKNLYCSSCKQDCLTEVVEELNVIVQGKCVFCGCSYALNHKYRNFKQIPYFQQFQKVDQEKRIAYLTAKQECQQIQGLLKFFMMDIVKSYEKVNNLICEKTESLEKLMIEFQKKRDIYKAHNKQFSQWQKFFNKTIQKELQFNKIITQFKKKLDVPPSKHSQQKHLNIDKNNNKQSYKSKSEKQRNQIRKQQLDQMKKPIREQFIKLKKNQQ